MVEMQNAKTHLETGLTVSFKNQAYCDGKEMIQRAQELGSVTLLYGDFSSMRQLPFVASWWSLLPSRKGYQKGMVGSSFKNGNSYLE